MKKFDLDLVDQKTQALADTDFLIYQDIYRIPKEFQTKEMLLASDKDLEKDLNDMSKKVKKYRKNMS